MIDPRPGPRLAEDRTGWLGSVGLSIPVGKLEGGRILSRLQQKPWTPHPRRRKKRGFPCLDRMALHRDGDLAFLPRGCCILKVTP